MNYLNYIVRILVDSLQAEQGGMVQVPAHIKQEDFKSRLFLRDERKFFLQLIPEETSLFKKSADWYVVKWWVIPEMAWGGGGGGGRCMGIGKLVSWQAVSWKYSGILHILKH